MDVAAMRSSIVFSRCSTIIQSKAQFNRVVFSLRNASAQKSFESLSAKFISNQTNDRESNYRKGFVPKAVITGQPGSEIQNQVSISPDRDNEEDNWQVKMLFDGECPLCMVEVNALKERNKSYGAIKFVDISSDDYSAEDNSGVEFEQAMGRIHCINRDGSIVTGVEAFRKFYDVLGMGWVYRLTSIKPIGQMADAVYDFWSKYRLPITGRPSLAVVLEERKKKKETECDVGDRCVVDFD